jgi:hypothetical protein
MGQKVQGKKPQPKKKNTQEAYQRIRAIITEELDDDDKERFTEIIEEQGFY